MTWRPTGVAFDTLPAGTMREVTAGETSILLLRVGAAVYAIDPVCPHLGGILAEGTLDGVRLRCGEHGAIFDARNGTVLADPFGLEPPEGGVDPVAHHPVRIDAGMIEVDLA